MEDAVIISMGACMYKEVTASDCGLLMLKAKGLGIPCWNTKKQYGSKASGPLKPKKHPAERRCKRSHCRCSKSYTAPSQRAWPKPPKALMCHPSAGLFYQVFRLFRISGLFWGCPLGSATKSSLPNIVRIFRVASLKHQPYPTPKMPKSPPKP